MNLPAAPLQALPDELLLRIFAAIPSPPLDPHRPDYKHPQALYILPRVSRRFKSQLSSPSSLWANLDITHEFGHALNTDSEALESLLAWLRPRHTAVTCLSTITCDLSTSVPLFTSVAASLVKLTLGTGEADIRHWFGHS